MMKKGGNTCGVQSGKGAETKHLGPETKDFAQREISNKCQGLRTTETDSIGSSRFSSNQVLEKT